MLLDLVVTCYAVVHIAHFTVLMCSGPSRGHSTWPASAQSAATSKHELCKTCVNFWIFVKVKVKVKI